MSTPENSENAPLFATTRWSVVMMARDGEDRDAAAAMETLCVTYCRALYAYARRHGLSPHDAEDATQAFFARLLEKKYLESVRAERGPFRAFLQMAFKRFLAKERDRTTALRRGGGATHLTFDFLEAETEARHWEPLARAHRSVGSRAAVLQADAMEQHGSRNRPRVLPSRWIHE
jgi:RNA polymerase sigma-70 factor (ECF subfamily)